MRLNKPYTVIETVFDSVNILKDIELYGRTAYKSEEKITQNSAKEFVKMILKRGHESVIEHKSISVRFICDRGVTHEIVRHRLASYTQESTRYCNYKGGVTFIIPCWIDIPEGEYKDVRYAVERLTTKEIYWFNHMLESELKYKFLIKNGWVPQQARSVLPNSLKTEIVVTMNLREWRHFFKLRCNKSAHPQMRELTVPLLEEFKEKIPIIFDDLSF